MLMGTGSTMSEWDPALLRLLAREHRLILFDYPGIGLSGPWHGRLLRLAGRRDRGPDGRDRPRAGERPGLVDGRFRRPAPRGRPSAAVPNLILAGTNPGGRQAVLGTRPPAQRIDSDPAPERRAEILHELSPAGRPGRGPALPAPAGHRESQRRDPRRLPRAGRTTDPHQVAAEDPWLRSDRNYHELSGIAAPTLAAAGAEDPVVPPVNLQRIAARIPGPSSSCSRRPRLPLSGAPPVHAGVDRFLSR